MWTKHKPLYIYIYIYMLTQNPILQMSEGTDENPCTNMKNSFNPQKTKEREREREREDQQSKRK